MSGRSRFTFVRAIESFNAQGTAIDCGLTGADESGILSLVVLIETALGNALASTEFNGSF
jgi:hypothetical protein